MTILQNKNMNSIGYSGLKKLEKRWKIFIFAKKNMFFPVLILGFWEHLRAFLTDAYLCHVWEVLRSTWMLLRAAVFLQKGKSRVCGNITFPQEKKKKKKHQENFGTGCFQGNIIGNYTQLVLQSAMTECGSW